ncbi:MAG TPA: hypothetical protein VHC22_10425 [Pirellulales bacterium]|nr:hypothetical protein [Pirellulales bacterium]
MKSSLGLQLAAMLLLCATGTVAGAVPPIDTLLPETTKGYVSAPDVDTLIDRWNETPMGKLLNDPIMRPFTEDLRRQLKEKWSKTHARLGVSITDLQGLATGEACLAVILPRDGDGSLAILADVTGKERPTTAKLDTIATNLKAQGAKATKQKLPGVEISVFDTGPKHDRDRGFSTIHFIKKGLFVATDSLAVAREVAAALDHPQQQKLASVTAYQTVMKRCRDANADADRQPDLRWFVEPIGLSEAFRSWETNRRKGSTDYLKVAKSQGFAAVKGIGGFASFGLGGYGVLHRTYIYAPPPYELAMRMAVFPNGGDFAPQEWIARDVSSYISFQADMLNAFDHFDTLFDEIYGEKGVWKDTLESIEQDPNGPQINLRRDLVQHLGNRATMITDYELPITPTSQRKLLAIEATDAGKLAAAIEKSMTGDEKARKLEIEGHVVWEIIPEDESMPALDIDDGGEGRRRRPADEDKDAHADSAPQVSLANSAVTVAKGHLMVASHIGLIRKVLARTGRQDQLVNDRNYLMVNDELPKLGASNDCARAFSRKDEQYRVMYELFKQGRLPEADTFLAHFINFIMGEEKEGVTRKPRLDGAKLPDYKVVQHYLGPAGSFVTSEPQGWFIVGFTAGGNAQLAKEARAANTK